MEVGIKVKSGGKWNEIEKIFIKDGGKWQEVESIYIKNGENWSTKLVPKDISYEAIEEYWSICKKRVRKKFWRDITKKTPRYLSVVEYWDNWRDVRTKVITKKTTGNTVIYTSSGKKTARIISSVVYDYITSTTKEAYYKWVDEYYSCKKNKKIYKTRRIWV